MTFGQRLREARVAEGLSQGELAEKVGVHHHTIAAWENDQAIPRADNAVRLLRALPALGSVPEVERAPGAPRTRMEATTIYLRPDQVVGLRALAVERARPVAELIRCAIDSLFASKAL